MASIDLTANITSQPAATAVFLMTQAVMLISAHDRYGSPS